MVSIAGHIAFGATFFVTASATAKPTPRSDTPVFVTLIPIEVEEPDSIETIQQAHPKTVAPSVPEQPRQRRRPRTPQRVNERQPTSEPETATQAAGTPTGSTALTAPSSSSSGITIPSAGNGGSGDTQEPVVATQLAGPERRASIRNYLRRVGQALGAPRPTRALRRARLEGVVMVALRIDPQGRILGVRIRQSSDIEVLDNATLAHIQQIARVPPPPTELNWITREITLPIRYRQQR